MFDPATNTATEINEYGPEISPRELELMYEKLSYLSKAAAWWSWRVASRADSSPASTAVS